MAETKSGNGSKAQRPILLWAVIAAAAVAWTGFFTQQAATMMMLVRWAATAVIMLAILMLVGREINNRWAGFLIDSRYKFSLSRLQITLWTVLTLSAYLTIALTRTLPGGMYPVDSSNEVVKQQQQECIVRMTANAQAEGQTTTPATVLAAAQEDCAQAQALNITFPPELLLALGISAASFAGSTLVQSTKKSKTITIKAVGGDLDPLKKKCDEAAAVVQAKKATLDNKTKNVNASAAAVEDAKKKLEAAKTANENIPEAEIALAGAQDALKLDQDDAGKAAQDWDAAKQALAAAQQELTTAQTQAENRLAASEGLLHKNSDPSQARWSDLFRAEEIGVNYKLLDISKVQMFFFTVALITAYAFALAALLQDTNAIHNPFWVDLPPFSSTMNVLLAISHGTYLSVKTVDRTPSSSE